MGMFDTFHYRCPNCGTENEEQTKSGDCVLADYTIDDVPPQAVVGIGTCSCKECGRCFEIELTQRPVYRLVNAPYEEPDRDEIGGSGVPPPNF